MGNPLKEIGLGTHAENSCKTPEEVLGGTILKIPGITNVESLDKSREEHREK